MAPPTHLFDPVIDPRPDGGDLHENGAAISKLFREGGPGTTVLLRPGKTYVIYSQVDLSHPGTTLATEGYPEFSTGQQAILETRGEKEAGAVRLFQLPRTALKRVHVRGCRGWGPKAPTPEEAERWKKEGRLGWIEGGGALIWAGGPEAYEQTIEGCRIEDPRGWTGVSLAFTLFPSATSADFVTRSRRSCTSSTLPSAAASSTTLSGHADNKVGSLSSLRSLPATLTWPGAAPGPWADGLSIAGKDSIVVSMRSIHLIP
jgi:hypothetical protein